MAQACLGRSSERGRGESKVQRMCRLGLQKNEKFNVGTKELYILKPPSELFRTEEKKNTNKKELRIKKREKKPKEKKVKIKKESVKHK